MKALRLLLALALVTSGCATTGPEAANDPVRLLVFGSPDELAAYRTLVAEYSKSAGGQQMQLVEASDRKDLITRLSTSIAGGAPPELFLMNYRFYGQFAAKNAIEPADQRLASSKTIKADDFYAEAMKAFQWQGKQLCMPQNVSSLVVYYNRDLFKKYEVAEPKAGWTWHDMVATASALTRDANGNQVKSGEPELGAKKAEVYGLATEASVIRLAPFVWSNGGNIVDDLDKPTKLTLDTPPARDALQNLLALRQTQGVVPSDEEVESEDDESRFANGRLGMLIQSRRSTTTFRKIDKFDWDVAPLPVYATPANVLHSDAYCMTKGARNIEGAWKFIEYALGREGATIMAKTGRTVPSFKEVANSVAFLDPTARPQNSKVFLDNISGMRYVPTISTWPEIEDVTGGILENALYRGDKLESVLADLDAKTRPIFARAKTS